VPSGTMGNLISVGVHCEAGTCPHSVQLERDAFACIERHQAFALAPVWGDPRADTRGPGRATHRISSCPLLSVPLLAASSASQCTSARHVIHRTVYRCSPRHPQRHAQRCCHSPAAGLICCVDSRRVTWRDVAGTGSVSARPWQQVRGSEFICGSLSHVHIYEQAGAYTRSLHRAQLEDLREHIAHVRVQLEHHRDTSTG
jgi:hypothetical protein